MEGRGKGEERKRRESGKVSHKRVFALQQPAFVLPGCEPISVNTLLCDNLGLVENRISLHGRTIGRN